MDDDTVQGEAKRDYGEVGGEVEQQHEEVPTTELIVPKAVESVTVALDQNSLFDLVAGLIALAHYEVVKGESVLVAVGGEAGLAGVAHSVVSVLHLL